PRGCRGSRCAGGARCTSGEQWLVQHRLACDEPIDATCTAETDGCVLGEVNDRPGTPAGSAVAGNPPRGGGNGRTGGPVARRHARLWLTAVAALALLTLAGAPRAAAVVALMWIAFVAYTWIAPPVLRRDPP